jgi:tetratricopeptide (TPR) repeat protein
MNEAILVGRRWRSSMACFSVAVFAAILLLSATLVGCGAREEPLLPRALTWAELRTVRSGVRVTPPGEGERVPYAKERLSDGSKIAVAAGGLAWLRRDAGAMLLVRGPAELTLRARTIKVAEGQLFADTPPGLTTEIETPCGKLALSNVRASIEVAKSGAVRAYVLSGEVRTEKARAAAGAELALTVGGSPVVRALRAWEDWTGGLATTDRGAAATPFGVGTVGARAAGEQGSPRFPLSIRRMDVRVTIDGDFALTEVDQTFFNPSSDVVEGLYGFRAPNAAILQRFGVDRDGVVVWGRVKEKAAAAAQYQANVYQGSTEDPALLEWDSPGVYRARLYPIAPGGTRRVVVRYAEWLDRTGERAERRLYVYPMAAEGSEDSLPHIEEFRATFDLHRTKAKEVRIGMAGVRRGEELVVREHDFVPRADLALELLDTGAAGQAAYVAPHAVDLATLPPSERQEAVKRAKSEADYVLVPVRPSAAKLPEGGLDLAIVVDSSAATGGAGLALARAATSALLSQLGERDRVLVFAGDAGLRPVLPDVTKLTNVDAATRRKLTDSLAELSRGGASDLGAMIADAARELDPARRSAIVYIGDAAPTVGELSLAALRERLERLPHPVRVFGLGVGDAARLDLLAGLSRGAFAERITDGAGAARAALHVLEEAERPAWLGTKVDLGASVERVFPREVSALVSGETLWVLGRLVAGKEPTRLVVTSPAGARETPLELSRIEDGGDLGRRWAEARLAQMLDDGEGRAALVDLGMKHGIITPVTSFYVPTANEMSTDEQAELAARRARQKKDAPGARNEVAPLASAAEPLLERALADDKAKEGGSGRGVMAAASPAPAPAAPPAPTEASKPAPLREEERAEKPKDANEFGTIGQLNSDAPSTPMEPAPSIRSRAVAAAKGGSASASDSAAATGASSISMFSGRGVGDAFGGGGLGLAGIGTGGGGRDRLGGSQKSAAPTIRVGALEVQGQLPREVVQRIVRQQFGHFRLCYERGAERNPGLEGRVNARFVIDKTGAVSSVRDAGSDLPDPAVVSCVLAAFSPIAFPQPEDSGLVTVLFPLTFGGAGSASSRPAPRGLTVNIFIGELPRELFGCSAAASTPLESRVPLWRERLATVLGNATEVANVYRRALGACEAYSARERSRLLSLMLDAMPGVKGKAALYQTMLSDLGARDVLYRGLLGRIKTPEEMRELHDALGLQNMDPGVLAKLVTEAKSPTELAAKLRALSRQFPDDFELALALLDALEDSSELDSLRDTARRLRARADVDARVRTAVGELYLRLGEREKTPESKATWVAEAERAFGEIVEFAPQDPVARRRLGDLLLAHGFFADAERQYTTLAALTPDEPKVFLLLAAATQAQGLLEAALKWAEKAGMSGAPDAESGTVATARALSATYLAWGRAEARAAKHSEELEALTARAARVLSPEPGGTGRAQFARVSLTWSHPELHPTLWTNALGSMMPAPDSDVTLGIAQANLPLRDDSLVEVRLEPSDLAHVVRLGAVATLTVVFDELGTAEKIVKLQVRFERGGAATQRFSLAGKDVRRG